VPDPPPQKERRERDGGDGRSSGRRAREWIEKREVGMGERREIPGDGGEESWTL
jgi:hypothetical protein